MPNWIPAPARTAPKEQIKSSSKTSKSSRRQSYPLCLVCEYDHEEVCKNGLTANIFESGPRPTP